MAPVNTPEPRDSVDLDAVLRSLLAGDGAAARGLDELALGALIDQARFHRVIGPTIWALDEAGVELADHVARTARERFQGAMAWCLELELRLIEIGGWFKDAGGIDFRVLKGAAVAHLDEDDPSQRSFADLDLLIASADMDRALEVLQAHGAQRRIPEHHRGFDRRFVKGVGLTCSDGVEIDVHRTLCVGALGFRIPLDELFSQPDSFTVGGEQFAAPRLEHRVLHAAYHAVMGTPVPALHTLRDLHRYLGRRELPPDVLVPEAARWRGETVLWSAVRALEGGFAEVSDQWREWTESWTPSEDDLRLIAASHQRARWPVSTDIVRELGWREGLAYTWGVLFPTPEVLEGRSLSRVGQIRRGLERLRGRR